jgi:hypothetical protein
MNFLHQKFSFGTHAGFSHRVISLRYISAVFFYWRNFARRRIFFTSSLFWRNLDPKKTFLSPKIHPFWPFFIHLNPFSSTFRAFIQHPDELASGYVLVVPPGRKIKNHRKNTASQSLIFQKLTVDNPLTTHHSPLTTVQYLDQFTDILVHRILPFPNCLQKATDIRWIQTCTPWAHFMSLLSGWPSDCTASGLAAGNSCYVWVVWRLVVTAEIRWVLYLIFVLCGLKFFWMFTVVWVELNSDIDEVKSD